MPHQLQGLAWMQAARNDDERRGVLLADDMGLGKTLQILSFLEWHRLRFGGSSLLIAPVTLLNNWKREYLRFFRGEQALEEGRVLLLHGELAGRVQRGRRLDLDALASYPLVITSYEMLRDCQLDLERVSWDVVALDEAQRIKNHNSQTARAARSLRSEFKIAATGTPVENGLGDLWSVLEFCHSGCLGPQKAFLRRYRADTGKDFEALTEGLQASIEPWFLRRCKKDILHNLPRKHEHYVNLVMKGTQAQKYAMAFREGPSAARGVMDQFWKLKRISCWTGDLSEADSCKVLWLLELLKTFKAAGEKAIIFAEMLEVQDLLVLILSKAFGIRVDVINGSTSTGSGTGSRQAILDRFERTPGFSVLVLSPVAAGVGLTILAANHVVHFSRQWNPAREDQATDRVYRIGQTREVHVYYPLANHEEVRSFDSYLSDLLTRKRKLAESALFPSLLGDVQGEELLDFFSGEREERIAELPSWLYLLRQPERFESLEEFLGALEQTGLALYRRIPRIARTRRFVASELAALAGRKSAFRTTPPEDIESVLLPLAGGEWVQLLARQLTVAEQIDYVRHGVMHRALAHLARPDQPGHWDRREDLQNPRRRWDREVQRFLEVSRG